MISLRWLKRRAPKQKQLKMRVGFIFLFCAGTSIAVRTGLRRESTKISKTTLLSPSPIEGWKCNHCNPGIGMLPAFNFICVETQPCETFYLASLAWMSVQKNKRKLWMQQSTRWEIKRPIPLRKGKREPESAEMADVDGEQRAST